MTNPLDPKEETAPEAWDKFWEDQFIWDEIWWDPEITIKAVGAVRRRKAPKPQDDEVEDEDPWEEDEEDEWFTGAPDDLKVLDADGNELEQFEVNPEALSEFEADYDGESKPLQDGDEVLIDLSDDDGTRPAQDAETGRSLTWWDPESIEVQDHRKVFVTKQEGRTTQRFPTAKDYLRYLESDLPEDVKKLGRQVIHLRGDNGRHTLKVSWEQALELARDGWPEGVKKVKALQQKLHAVVVGLIPDTVVKHQETGEMLDMGRFVEGDPEMFMTMVDEAVKEEKRKPQIVRIVTTVDVARSPDAYIMRGAAILAVCQLLQDHGYRVQIDCHIGSNDVVDTWVRIKETDESINLEKMVFYTAHPVMFHRMSYAAWAHLSEDDRRRAGGLATRSYGWISEPPVNDRGDVYVSAVQSSWCLREESTVQWVVDCLKGQGIEVGE